MWYSQYQITANDFFLAFWSLTKKLQYAQMSLYRCNESERPTIFQLEMQVLDQRDDMSKYQTHMQIAGLCLIENNISIPQSCHEIPTFLNQLDISVRKNIVLLLYYETKYASWKLAWDCCWKNLVMIFTFLRDFTLTASIPAIVLAVKKAFIVFCLGRIGITNRSYKLMGSKETCKEFLYRLLIRDDAKKISESINTCLEWMKDINFDIYEEFLLTLEEIYLDWI